MTGTDVTEVGKVEQAELKMQAGVDIQAGIGKHELGFGQPGEVHELMVKMLMVLEEEVDDYTVHELLALD